MSGARALGAALAILTVAGLRAPSAAAQVSAGVGMVAATVREVGPGRRASGLGAVVSGAWRRGTLELAASLDHVSLSPRDSGADFGVWRFDLRASRRVSGLLDVEVGVARATVSPAFATQDVGTVRIGVGAHSRLSSAAAMWLRAAVMPVVKFNGGGSAGLSIAFGTGTSVTWGRRGQVGVAYEFQRFDRVVQAVNVPLSWNAVRLEIRREI